MSRAAAVRGDVANPEATARLRVLFVCSSLTGGGAERFVSTVLGFLDRERFAPSLCLLRGERSYPLPEDVPLSVLGKQRPWHLPRSVARLARLLDALRPEVVLSAFSYPSFVTGNALALARHRPRWVARVASNPDHAESGWLRPWMRRLYARADLVVANSRALCRRVDLIYPDARRKARYLPNAADFARLDALAAETAEPPPRGRLRIASVGRLDPVKRFDLLLDALAHLRAHREVELVLCGEGPERERLRRRARRLGLEDRVQLRGFTANPYRWIAASQLFALASDMEGLPNALVEAQGLGLAAVATDCATGPREIVDDGETGLLVPPGNAPALAAAMGALLGDPARRLAMGAAARARTRARFSAPEVTRELETILLEAAGRTREP
jgi:N-acetylgalactosamine-N,N'-diacetylbacillosaminyl-diphospho-undecaprenol 4-alpha-N-acetylgalactosaminyltransferase